MQYASVKIPLHRKYLPTIFEKKGTLLTSTLCTSTISLVKPLAGDALQAQPDK
jgi:hypothetical protein